MSVDLRLYALIDPARAGGRDLAPLAAACVAGGATLVQYRDKHADTRTLVARAGAIKAAMAGSGVPLLINDRVDVALAMGAGGVHLGQDDMNAADARRLLGTDAFIGVSVTAEAHADALAGAPIDYACIGAVFATASKDGAKRPVGLSGLAALAARVRQVAPGLPVGAISGIDATNAASVIGAGADGIAVISAIGEARDPADAARRLRAIVDQSLAARGAEAMT